MLTQNFNEFARWIYENNDYATVALIAFLFGLSVHQLLLFGTLRRIKRNPMAHRLIKTIYKDEVRPIYGTLSLLFALSGVLFILSLWFVPRQIVLFLDEGSLLLLALLCFILSGYVYLVGLAKATVQVVNDLLKQPTHKRG